MERNRDRIIKLDENGEPEYSVYLAGKIAGLTYEAAMEIREEITEKLSANGIKCRTPLRGSSFFDSKHLMDGDYLKHGLSMQECIGRDLNDINYTDATVILTGADASWGTSGEFYYATWIAKKPTLVISDSKISGWLEYFATRIVHNVDEAVEVLKHWKRYWNGVGIYDLR